MTPSVRQPPPSTDTRPLTLTPPSPAKTKQTYLTSTRNGGIWTIILGLVCTWLTFTELSRWLVGHTTHTFSVERGVAHELQINLDVVVAMQCKDLHVNVQDAAGDRIMAGELLHKDPTNWSAYVANTPTSGPARGRGSKQLKPKAGEARNVGQGWQAEQALQYAGDEDVHDYLAAARGRRRFAATPSLRGAPDSCRVYGSIEGNKVQGDFHITARGHGYTEFGEHLDHAAFNFSHHVRELSFGPFYPLLANPLDGTTDLTPDHFHKFQYHLSIVPTIYTDAPHRLTSSSPPGVKPGNGALPEFNPWAFSPHTVYTNQYAATSSSRKVAETAVPGIFVKYDIEPILLTVAEEWGGVLGMLVRCVNVVAGVLVAGGWLVSLVDWVGEGIGRRRRAAGGADGLLHGGARDGKESYN